MATDKASQQQPKTKQLRHNPLADIAGKFGGKFWLETQSEIQKSRQIDKAETNKHLDTESEQQD